MDIIISAISILVKFYWVKENEAKIFVDEVSYDGVWSSFHVISME